MKFSVSNWIYGDEPIQKTIKRLVKFKYDGIEIKGEPREYDAKEVSDLLNRYGLEASSIAGIYPWPTEERDLANPDEKVRKRAIEYVKDCVSFAVKINAPLVIVTPSCVAKVKPLGPIEKEWNWAVASVKEVGKHAEDMDVYIAIEPINRYETYLVNNCEQALRFMEEVNLENVKIMLDCFHMNIEEADPATAIRKAGKNLIHVHVADSNRQSVGRGHIDFKSIIRSLNEIGYQKYLAMEPLPPTANPYALLKGLKSEEFYDQYAAECIELLRFLKKICT